MSPIYLCGPTASGKTALSIALANALGGEIVNADAYQIYRGMEILSAAPSREELDQAPHHLFSSIDLSHHLNAQTYLELAKPILQDIIDRGKTPIVVGGSGMYLKFLTHGPSPLPAGDDTLRAELETRSDAQLIEQLRSLDPQGAAQTNLQNRRYVIRALEICLLSGRPMSQLKTHWQENCTEIETTLRGIVLHWDIETLRHRIQRRTAWMFENGVTKEVAALKDISTTAEKAIGLRDIRSYLKGEITRERCQELLFFATCQYAKRQRTWFRREPWLHSLDVHEGSATNELVQTILRTFDLRY